MRCSGRHLAIWFDARSGGPSNWKTAPRLAAAETQIFPPWFSMMERQIESPIPGRRDNVIRGPAQAVLGHDLIPRRSRSGGGR